MQWRLAKLLRQRAVIPRHTGCNHMQQRLPPYAHVRCACDYGHGRRHCHSRGRRHNPNRRSAAGWKTQARRLDTARVYKAPLGSTALPSPSTSFMLFSLCTYAVPPAALCVCLCQAAFMSLLPFSSAELSGPRIEEAVRVLLSSDGTLMQRSRGSVAGNSAAGAATEAAAAQAVASGGGGAGCEAAAVVAAAFEAAAAALALGGRGSPPRSARAGTATRASPRWRTAPSSVRASCAMRCCGHRRRRPSTLAGCNPSNPICWRLQP